MVCLHRPYGVTTDKVTEIIIAISLGGGGRGGQASEMRLSAAVQRLLGIGLTATVRQRPEIRFFNRPFTWSRSGPVSDSGHLSELFSQKPTRIIQRSYTVLDF